jgi:hypothetical protein
VSCLPPIRLRRAPIGSDYQALYYYGNPVQVCNLSNTQIGGPTTTSPGNRVFAYTFQAPKSGTLTGVRVKYAIAPGYGGGTGGTAVVALYSDDGSAKHLPNTSLTSAPGFNTWSNLGGVGVSLAGGPVLHTFSASQSVTAGTWYHIVTSNSDGAKNTNYFSVDDISPLWLNNTTSWPPFDTTNIRSPALGWTQWSCKFQDNGGSWTLRPDYYAIIDLIYSDGSNAGMSYSDNPTTSDTTGHGHSISGAGTGVGETFTIRGPTNKVVTALWLNCQHVSGSDPLTATIYDNTAGNLGVTPMATVTNVGSVPIVTPAGTTATTYWTSFSLPSPLTFKSGNSYDVRFTCPGTSQYYIYAGMSGSRESLSLASPAPTIYPTSLDFGDGHAYYNNGGTWTAGWDVNAVTPGTSPSTNCPMFWVATSVSGTTTPLGWSTGCSNAFNSISSNTGAGTSAVTYTGTTQWSNPTGSRYITSGQKVYWELTGTFGASSYVGISNLNCQWWQGGHGLYADADTVWWQAGGSVQNNNGSIASWNIYTGTNRLGIALDLVNNRIWGRVFNGTSWGNWNNSGGTANPTTNVGGLALPAALVNPYGPGGIVAIVPSCQQNNASDVITIYSTAASWLSSPAGNPSGFSAP